MKLITKVFLLACLVAVTGCTTDGDNPVQPDPGQNGEKNVTLEVRIPGARTPSTYGMTAGQENQVSQLTVLAYKDISGTEELQQMIVATSSEFTSDGSGNVKVTLSLPAGDYSRLVVVANANSQVGALADDSPISELNAIEYTHASGQWDTATPDYIPMTGEVIAGTTNGISIRQGQSKTFSGLNLVRMLARVDIINNATSTFTLKDVMLYNFKKNGLLVNDDTQYGASPAQPNLPGTLQNATSPLTYNYTALQSGNKMEGEIYAFEAAAPVLANIATSPRIIIKGTYSGTDYFYPVDFTYDGSSGTTKGAFMPVVRNHKYIFTVSQVSGPGFATADAALASTEVITNIDVQVFVIDENLTDVYWDAKNYLAVNAPDFDFGYEAVTAASTGNTFTVKSTAPWTIECFEADGTTSIPNGGWLSVNPATGTATSTATVSVLVAANGGAARTGKLIIQSGLFTHIVTVNQEVMSPTANSFIVAPNTNNYAIPVRNCNMSDLGIQLNDGETFTAEVVWESDANAVSTVTVNGSGPYGNIVVSTGSAEGNGVVCIKKGGVILWSWHIWVTNYNPETGTYVSNGQTFMERNLGAMNNTPGDVGSLGLMYQWGRKDPFPGSASTTANTEPTYATVTKTQAPAGTSPNYNIGVAVANPLTFYTGSSANSYDWYSITASIKNDALWGASKTIYDPCPEGWKVPASGPTSDSPWYDLTSQWFSVGTGADWTLNGRGYYPACGHRGRADGNLTALDTGRGLYGSSAINGNNVKYLDFGPGALNTNSNQARGYASAIRCVVE